MPELAPVEQWTPLELKPVPTPWQRLVLRDKHQFIVICAGRRTGKTILSLMESVKTATTMDGANCWYIAPTYGMAKAIAWDELKQIMEQLRPFGWIGKVYESDLLIRLANGSTIQLKGSDNEDALRGLGLDFVVLDEYAIMRRQVWDEILRPSVVDRKGRALFISTPKGYNHFHELYGKESSEPDKWKSYHFKTVDNPYIPKAEIEQAQRDMDARAFRQEFEASFETFGGQVFPDFDRHKHAAKSLTFNAQMEYCLGMDFGWSAPTVTLFINVDTTDNVSVFAEQGVRETPIGVIAKKFNEIVPDKKPALIACDPAGDNRNEAVGTSSVNELESIFGYDAVRYVRNYPGIIQDGIDLIRKWIRNGKLFIDPKCINLIQALEMYRYPDPKGDIRSEVPLKDGVSDHWIDALRYFFLNRFPQSKSTVGAL